MNLRLFIAAISLCAACVQAEDRQIVTGAAVPKSTSFSVDVSGIWWNPNESGWGMNVIQESQTLFVTLFIYAPDGSPTWLVGPSTTYTFGDSSGALVFSGNLYSTRGPWFGASTFNPNNVSVTQVGTITIRFQTYASAQVTYTANGVDVVKNVVPQTWLVNNLGLHGIEWANLRVFRASGACT